MSIQIADFGLSRDLMDEDYYVSHGGKIPVKWTAPEVTNLGSCIIIKIGTVCLNHYIGTELQEVLFCQ